MNRRLFLLLCTLPVLLYGTEKVRAADSGSPEESQIHRNLHFIFGQLSHSHSEWAEWLLYLALEPRQASDSQPETQPAELWLDLQSEVPRVQELQRCVASSDHSARLAFVFCADAPALYLAYLHDHPDEESVHSRILRLLNTHTLSIPQQTLLQLYLNESSLEAYHAPANGARPPELADFYFFDHHFSAEHSARWPEAVQGWAESWMHAPATFESAAIARYFVITNALFKLYQEPVLQQLATRHPPQHQFPVSRTSLRMARYLSFAAYHTGFYQQDIDLNRDLVLPLAAFFDREAYYIARMEYAVSLNRVGQLDAALSELRHVREAVGRFSDYRYQIALLNNLAIITRRSGNMTEYISLQHETLELARENDDHEMIASRTITLYNTLLMQGNETGAEEYFKQLEVLIHDGSSIQNRYQLESLRQLRYERKFNDSQSALQSALRRLALSRESGDFFNVRISLANVVRLKHRLGLNRQALPYLDEYYQLARERGIDNMLAYAILLQTRIHRSLGNRAEAQRYFEALLQIDPETLVASTRMERVLEISAWNRRQELQLELIDELEACAREFMDFTLLSRDYKTGHLGLAAFEQELFGELVQSLLESGRTERAIFWLEELKNMSVASFYNNPALKAQIIDESELLLDYTLHNRLERLRGRLPSATASERLELLEEIVLALEQLNNLQRRVVRHAPAIELDLQRLQRRIGRSEAIVHYSLLNGRENDLLMATLITGSDIYMHPVVLSNEEITRLDYIVEELSSDRLDLTELQWLRERILDPLPLPENLKSLYVIPDGFLYELPLEMFPLGQVTGPQAYGEARYLVESVAISYANSLRDLQRAFEQPRQRSYAIDLLAMGISIFSDEQSRLGTGFTLSPLPLAEEEVRRISDRLNRTPEHRLFLGEDSRESAFRTYAPDARIIHIASHSEVYETDPLYSVIYLQNEDDPHNPVYDGHIYAYELFGMNLNSEMVVMNSCESGAGSFIQGSGIMGFSRAVKYAGAHSVMMNVWKIRDRSAYELSVQFYENLNSGMQKHKALQLAKKHHINYVNSNPLHWAPLVVYGNVDTLQKERRYVVLIAFATVFLLFLVLFATIRYRKRVASNNTHDQYR